MKILGIDSSGNVASVSLLSDGVLMGEYSINNKLTHSQTLLPMVDAMLQTAGVEPEELDAIAISAGPGSFTGLRIGAATAKGLAQALEIPVVKVPTLAALAYNLAGVSGLVCPVMDARRGQVYAGVYRYEGEQLVSTVSEQAVDMGELLDMLNEKGEPVTFLGDGVPVQRELIAQKCRVPYRLAPSHLALQHAGSVAVLASRAEVYGDLGVEQMAAAAFAPEYLRVSQAERERAARETAIGERR